MKKVLEIQRYDSGEEVESVVRRWLYAQKTEFYEQDVLNLVSRGVKMCQETWFL
ncbi:hypothetical protein ANN_08115 [Periplaneta americana]|uniref:Uncharacterized protein n=1 Tax=Periplaneta americana TaxID=6978 RepID=A0ABQ8T1P7_PERAM|nr:hypothetical protein ANN_08115 [Periplaneta americana]